MFGIIFFSFYLAVKWELLMIFISLCTAEHNGMKYIYEYLKIVMERILGQNWFDRINLI